MKGACRYTIRKPKDCNVCVCGIDMFMPFHMIMKWMQFQSPNDIITTAHANKEKYVDIASQYSIQLDFNLTTLNWRKKNRQPTLITFFSFQ